MGFDVYCVRIEIYRIQWGKMGLNCCAIVLVFLCLFQLIYLQFVYQVLVYFMHVIDIVIIRNVLAWHV